MKRILFAVMVGILVAGASSADEHDAGGWYYDNGLHFTSADERFAVHVGNRIQVRGNSRDPNLGGGERSFDLSNYKLMVDGHVYSDWEYGIQLNFREEPGNQSFLLEDAWIQFARAPLAQVWLGQGKVPFGRQLLTSSGDLQFVDRSIAAQRFHHTQNNADNPRIGRDVGIALVGEAEKYSYALGAYNGNGINQGGDDNQNELFVARLVVTPLGPMPLRESNPQFTDRKARVAIGVSVMTFEEGPPDEERTNMAGLELALQAAGFSFVGEYFTENEDRTTGTPPEETETDGWYAQAGWAFPVGEIGRLEFAARASEILEEKPQTGPFDPRDRSETGGAISLYWDGHDAKLQADWRDVEVDGPETSTDTADFTEFRIQLTLSF